ncbi:hypothetical protein, partial [Massilia sp.]|uniref:hypothetical protein n=1 Tax=Massilia sp. TaxID=1882437 RepID=UPI0028A1212B
MAAALTLASKDAPLEPFSGGTIDVHGILDSPVMISNEGRKAVLLFPWKLIAGAVLAATSLAALAEAPQAVPPVPGAS